MISTIVSITILFFLGCLLLGAYNILFVNPKKKKLIQLRQMFDNGRYLEVLPETEKLVKSIFAPLAYELMANCYSEMDREEEALQLYRKALTMDAGLPFSHIGIGKLMLREYRYDDAIEEFNRALKVDPANTVAKYYTAIAFEGKGDYEKALDELESAKIMNPAVEAVYEKQIDIYTYLGKSVEAHATENALRLLREQGN